MLRRQMTCTLASLVVLAPYLVAAQEPPEPLPAPPDSAPATPEEDPGLPVELPPPPVEINVAMVHHAPPATAAAEEPLRITATVTAIHLLAELTLYYRRADEAEFHAAPFGRIDGAHFVAEIPADAVEPPFVAYYIASRAVGAGPSGGERLHFASPAMPQIVEVPGDEELRIRRDLLAQHLGNRSRFGFVSEVVNFGQRGNVTSADGTTRTVNDLFYRLEADYTYRILGPIYSIRIAAGLMSGDTYHVDDTGARVDVSGVGFKYGLAEVRFRLGTYARVDARVTVGGGPEHFDGGVGAQLIIGRDVGTHLALFSEVISTIGARGFVRLAWNTVPRVPMSFTVEATTWPRDNDVSGRLYFTAGYRIGTHFTIDGQLGYAARDFHFGGLGGGLALGAEF